MPLAKKLLIVVGSQAAVVVIVVTMLTPWYGSTPSRILTSLLIGVTHSVCVGSLAWLTMPYVGEIAARQGFVVRWLVLVVSLVVLSAVGSMVADISLGYAGLFPPNALWSMFNQSFRISTVISLVIGFGGYGYFSMKYRLYQKELNEEKLQKLASEARLSSLESRLQPHFLFNTLNSIAALIPEDPKAAEQMTSQLAAVLRFSLDSSDGRTVSLERELKFVSDYLEIERTRFGDRLGYEIDVPTELGHVSVPPFCLQTLVENSVKYGGKRIRINALRRSDSVSLEVSDSGPGFSEKDLKQGHGLDNLQGRLAALWGDDAKLEIISNGAGCSVRLSIPMKAPR